MSYTGRLKEGCVNGSIADAANQYLRVKEKP